MNRLEKSLLWVVGTLGVVLLLLLFALTVVAPRLLHDDSIRARIRQEFARAVGGTLDFDRMGLSIFPRPGIVVYGASLTIPETGRGAIESVKVCPSILPLFRGKVRIANLRIEGPALALDAARFPELRRKRSDSEPPPLDKRVASLFETLASKVPGLEVLVEKGSVDLVRGGQTVLSIEDLGGSLLLPPRGPEIRITCRSDLWQDLSLDAQLDPKSLQGRGRLELSRFRPHLLTDRFLPDAGFTCSESALYLRADVHTDGLRRFDGEVKASIPGITVIRNQEEAELRLENLGIAFSVDEEKTELSLDQLRMLAPRLSLSGRFQMTRTDPDVRLELEARDMDVDAVRPVALSLGGELRLIRDIFEFVRGGEIPLITFKSRASVPARLGNDEAFRIEGRLLDGKVHVRGPDLDLEEVRGEVVISKGFLDGSNLEARLGNSRGSRGKLRIGLKGKDSPFHLDIRVDADMAEVKPILMRVVKAEGFVRELSLVGKIEGRGQGSMTLGESLQSIEAKVDVSTLSLSAEHKRIPHGIRIESGEVHYETGRIGGTSMSGTLGASSFSGLTFRVGFAGSPQLEIESGTFRLSMDEIYPWLVSYESIRKDLKNFKDIRGRVELTDMRLTGPILRPADWDFEAKAVLENLTVDTPLCPKPVPVASGTLRATPEKLFFSQVKGRLLDASIHLPSGVLTGHLTGLQRAELELGGNIGKESSAWVSGGIRLPPALQPRAPFSLQNAKLVWNKEGETSFQGDFAFREGVEASLDLARSAESFLLKRLSFQDPESRATLSVTRTEDTLGLNFTGKLENTTLDKVLVKGPAPDVALKGDFLLNIRRDKPDFSKAQGHLEARNFTVPYGWMARIRIEDLNLDASEQGIRVESARLVLEESPLFLQGDLGFAPEGIQLDMDVAAEEMHWDAIQRVIDAGKAPADARAPSPLPPVQGTVRCKAESFTYEQLTWMPLQGTVTFSPDDLRVAFTEGDMCGISTLGAINLDGEEIQLDVKLIAKDQDLKPVLPCLSDTEREVTGRFDLNGSIHGKARGDDLMRALQGGLELHARDGTILRDPVLAKVFSVLNVTEILRGKMPDLASDHLPYSTLSVKADIRNGKLVVNETALTGPTVGIAGDGTVDFIDKKLDVRLVVAPLRTVDFIVEKTPVVSNIMGGKLITVPVRISGHWRDPDVTMLSAAAVGTRLFEIMKNTLMLPIDLAEPVIPNQKKRKSEP